MKTAGHPPHVELKSCLRDADEVEMKTWAVAISSRGFFLFPHLVREAAESADLTRVNDEKRNPERPRSGGRALPRCCSLAADSGMAAPQRGGVLRAVGVA